MKLSVIIVNYNVRYFLEQCLHSLYRAIENTDTEVFVVDNCSTDDSLEMLRKSYPRVKLIANSENPGFAKANNQAIIVSEAEYILLLNPDTLVQENAIHNMLSFMDAHPEAGALGVKMIDGQGRFLPESKRGLPTPAVSFYKILGLSTLFPRSRRFGRYHLGWLDKDKIHSVEILAGACMLVRKDAINKAGLLDEDFFMYGEDIDWSYRILKAGYRNYYFPPGRILHYKGESTKKGSLNYVYVFHKAMAIFAKKHFLGKSFFYAFLINVAILLSGTFSFFSGLFRKSLYFLKKMSSSADKPSVLVWGSLQEFERVRNVYSAGLTNSRKFIHATTEEQLNKVMKDNTINELIFCTTDLQYSLVFDCMEKYAGKGVVYKTAPPIGQVIIGSHRILKR
ncbi:MAG: glycosyltransferase family 2 protein [Bacteroidales bacterium]|nr:glycosyltransferase family 2 protein [Bacteroidales bacterium]MDD3430982.1 glycosyltransferase family 2 protein [Bacteroidales bacterium]MDD4361542.1 glycosyltransferase family 2 protein [Bacteroidales bacterium]